MGECRKITQTKPSWRPPGIEGWPVCGRYVIREREAAEALPACRRGSLFRGGFSAARPRANGGRRWARPPAWIWAPGEAKCTSRGLRTSWCTPCRQRTPCRKACRPAYEPLPARTPWIGRSGRRNKVSEVRRSWAVWEYSTCAPAAQQAPFRSPKRMVTPKPNSADPQALGGQVFQPGGQA